MTRLHAGPHGSDALRGTPGTRLPRCAGTYVLVMHAADRFDVRAGGLGRRVLPAGWYLYVGSALGAGGLAARCSRHVKSGKVRHWHVDYLASGASVREIWYLCGEERLEHSWAGVLADGSYAQAAWPGFGASDCRCLTHLCYVPGRPDLTAFDRLAGSGGIRRQVVQEIRT